jgi:toxin-antitoxin system, antitoxin component, xre family
MVLMSQQHPEKHIESFAFMMNRCDEREIEFALHMIEQILRGQEDYLSE